MFLLILAFFFQTISSDSIEHGWKGIESLKTNKVNVEKLLGEPKIYGSGIHTYETEEAEVQVNYSTEPCKRSDSGRGNYVVPKDTVLEYSVTMKKPLKLDNLKYNREKYEKSQILDQYTELRKEFFDYTYTNKDEGIEITIKVRDGVEYIYQISFEPRIKNIGYQECKSNINLVVENGWEGIKVFQTSKAEVEKILGKPTEESIYASEYKTEAANIRVKYSTEPCRKDQFGINVNRGEYNIPPNKVFMYEVYLYKALKVADLKYRKKLEPDPESGYKLANVDEGIYVLTRKRDNSEYVTMLTFEPGLKYKNLKCKTIKE